MATNKSSKKQADNASNTEPITSATPPAWLPLAKHLGVYLFLLVVAVFYFKPVVFDGKALEQIKLQQREEMLTEYRQHKQATKESIRWTNQVFVGMPTAALGVDRQNYCKKYLLGATRLFSSNKDWTCLLGVMLGAYVGLVLFGVDWLIAAMLALFLGLFTTNSIYISSGNIELVQTLATIPLILGATFFAYRKNLFLGTSLAALGWSLNLAAGSMRITYYLAFAFVGLLFLLLLEALKQQKNKEFGKFVGAMLFALLLGGLSNLSTLWSSYEYSQESARGYSELTKKDYQYGLPLTYLFDLSLEKMETATLMFPDFYGGASNLRFYEKENSATKNAMNDLSVQKEILAVAQAQGFDANAFLNQVIYQYSSQYRGSQSVSEGPNYYGVVVCVLLILSLLLLQGAVKWGFVALFTFFAILAWGRNLAGFNELMYAYFPFYKLFEAPKMTLVAMQPIAILVIGLGFKKWLDFDAKPYDGTITAKLITGLKQPLAKQGFVVLTGAIALFICVVVGLLGMMGSVEVSTDVGLMKISPKLLAAIQADRSDLISATVLRTLIFVVITTSILFLAAKEIIRKPMLLLLLGLIACVDFGLVNSNYINEKSYQDLNYKERVQNAVPSKANTQIVSDRAYYRVADYSLASPSQNSITACFHKTIGGNFIDRPMLHQELWTGYNFDSKDIALQQLGTFFNMLNVKYYIVEPTKQADNHAALGHVWFVNKIKQVNDANEELESLGDLVPQLEAVVQKKNAKSLEGLANTAAPTDKIYLKTYHPDTMVYISECTNERFAVFSEMYYPPNKGWSVYINDKKVDGFIKTNFLLRGMRVPAGKNTIKIVFEPQSISIGQPVEMLCSIFVLLLLGGAIWIYFKMPKNE